jgi:hypothetical protein
LVELVEFGLDYLFDVDDDFLCLELLFVEVDLMAERLNEGVDGS